VTGPAEEGPTKTGSGAGPDGGETITRNTAFAFATQISTSAFTAVITIYLVRVLGPATFGVFALATSISLLLMRPADVGTTQSAARFVAERHGRPQQIAGVLGMALPMRIATGTAIGVVLFVVAGPISDLYSTPELFWPLRAVAIAFVGQSVMRFVFVMLVALRRSGTGFWLVTLESTTELTATVALVMLGGGATGAAFGRAIGYVFGACLGLFLLARVIGRSPLRGTGPSPVSRREFVSYAGAMFVVSGAFSAFTVIDVLLIGAFLTTTAVGTFSAPMQLIGFLGFPGLAVAQGIAPRLARHPDEEPMVAALERAIRYLLVLQAAALPVITVWAGPLVELVLGPEFSESAEVLAGLAPYMFLTGIGPLLVAPLNYRGEGRRRIPLAVGALVLNAAIDVVLLPTIGVMGAVIGTNVAFFYFIGGHVWLSHRLIGLPLRGIAVTLARSLVAAAAMAGVLWAVGTADLSPLQWVVGLVAGGGAYLAVLLATREITPRELRTLALLPASALRRG
jgi:O-antigen/teichoic acid export membrane protein